MTAGGGSSGSSGRRAGTAPVADPDERDGLLPGSAAPHGVFPTTQAEDTPPLAALLRDFQLEAGANRTRTSEDVQSCAHDTNRKSPA